MTNRKCYYHSIPLDFWLKIFSIKNWGSPDIPLTIKPWCSYSYYELSLGWNQVILGLYQTFFLELAYFGHFYMLVCTVTHHCDLYRLYPYFKSGKSIHTRNFFNLKSFSVLLIEKTWINKLMEPAFCLS